MLRIRKQAKIEFDGKPLEISPKSLGDFLLGATSEQVTIEEGVTLGEVMNVCFHLKGFILNYFVEHYDQLNALIASGVMVQPISKVVFYKEMVISPESEVMIYPKVRAERTDQKMSGYFDVPIEISPELKVVDENNHMQPDQKLYTHFTFLDLLGGIFEEFQEYITVAAGSHA